MGYQTLYELSILEGGVTVQEVLKENEDFEGLHYAIDVDGESTEPVKWYSRHSDMIELSKKCPEVVFMLQGEGESNDDMWINYFKNGKSQLCMANITFDSYDEAKLVEI